MKPESDLLERLFHEPSRLAIMSSLCAADGGLTFTELKDSCGLTDGNLSRHLKALEDAKAVRIDKTFVGVKPRTTVKLTPAGLDRFREYLDALEDVLEKARQALPAPRNITLPFTARPART
jgi:DNA-binding transcriptional ArsR family regulator